MIGGAPVVEAMGLCITILDIVRYDDGQEWDRQVTPCCLSQQQSDKSFWFVLKPIERARFWSGSFGTRA